MNSSCVRLFSSQLETLAISSVKAIERQTHTDTHTIRSSNGHAAIQQWRALLVDLSWQPSSQNLCIRFHPCFVGQSYVRVVYVSICRIHQPSCGFKRMGHYRRQVHEGKPCLAICCVILTTTTTRLRLYFLRRLALPM